MTVARTKPNSINGSLAGALPDETLVRWLRDMVKIREFEVRTMQAYANAKVGGFCHVYTGQEACAVGTVAAIRKDDPLITAYRDHGHALARGMDPGACMAEMYGKVSGCAKGKGGSMHMFDRPNHLYGGHGIVGGQIPLGVGLAFAAKYRMEVMGAGEKKIALCFLGDGAVNQGAFHEAMNLAGVLEIPVVIIVENNGYSMGTSIQRGTTMAENLVVKAAGYGIKAAQIDGMDVMALYDEFKPLVEWCRENQKPAFVDLKTYRYQGHSMSDPQRYRTKEEVAEFQERDCIGVFAKRLIVERGALSEADYKAMQKELRVEIKAAVKFAEESPFPEAAKELYSDVYANPMRGLSPIREYHSGAVNPLLEQG